MKLDVGSLPLFVEKVGSGPPLILVHGFGAHRYTWRNWAGALAKRYTLYLVDMKGFGDAPKPADDQYSPADQADLITALILRKGLEGAFYCGHSLGGAVGILTALRLADLGARPLGALVDVAGPAFSQGMPKLIGLARAPGAHLALRAMPAEKLVRMALKEAYHPDSPRDDRTVAGYARTLRGTRAARALVRSAVQIEPPDLDSLIARYPTITTPTLLLWGRQDRVVRVQTAYRLAEMLPDAELHVLEDCGHVPQDERPAESLTIVTEFLDRHRPGASRSAGA